MSEQAERVIDAKLDELMPCPFCAGKADLSDTGCQGEFDDICFVECLSCEAQAGWDRDRAKAIATWNRRQPVSTPAGEELREAVAHKLCSLLGRDWRSPRLAMRDAIYDRADQLIALIRTPQEGERAEQPCFACGFPRSAHPRARPFACNTFRADSLEMPPARESSAELEDALTRMRANWMLVEAIGFTEKGTNVKPMLEARSAAIQAESDIRSIVARLEADRERLDKLERARMDVIPYGNPASWTVQSDDGIAGAGFTLREAIDAMPEAK